jgi:UDP-N-acetylmuramoylalanine--D-glutamate ligase
VGVPPSAVRDGLASFTPDGHRIADLGQVGGVRYVDDSKATNPHAAASSLQAYDSVVWVAGGLAKGASFDGLVGSVGSRLRGVVLLGRDRDVIAGALARHAPDVRVIVVEGDDTSVMDRVVGAAAGLAQPGDTVLLAPGCASMDMFANYGARGDAFAESVRRLRAR